MKKDDLHKHLEEIKEYLRSELLKVRVGRASAALVEDIKVSAYDGADPLNLNEVATVNLPDPLSIQITPWDKSIIKKVEDAIIKSNRGLSPVNDGQGNLRINMPQLTEDKRKEVVKDVKQKVEGSRIKVRNVRQDAIKSVEEQQKEGMMSEDDMFREKKQIEEDISKVNKELEEIGRQKESEIMTL